MRAAMWADRTVAKARIKVLRAIGASARKPSPPAGSGWLGVNLRLSRETRQSRKNQTKSRYAQRVVRNWKIGMLTWAYHWPARVSRRPVASGTAYQVEVARLS